MSVRPATRILDATALARTLRRLAHEIVENHADMQRVVLVGIQEGGVSIAEALGNLVSELVDGPIRVGALDPRAFRDDRPRFGSVQDSVDDVLAMADGSGMHSITGQAIILVDDVIQTGRTLRASLDAVTSIGRPARVESAVLIDRGQREFPLKPDYVGKNIPAATNDWVDVRLGAGEESGAYVVTRA